VDSLQCACDVQLTDEMLELASDKRDEAMAAVADGWFHTSAAVYHDIIALS